METNLEIPDSAKTVIATSIVVCGTFTNALSLSYFIRRENKGIGTRLLMLLNSLDLFVCVSGIVDALLLFYGIADDSIPSIIIRKLYISSVEATSFATCLLSVTRTIILCQPFYRLRGKAIILATVTFVSYVAVRYIWNVRMQLTGTLTYERAMLVIWLNFATLSMIILTVHQ